MKALSHRPPLWLPLPPECACEQALVHAWNFLILAIKCVCVCVYVFSKC